jgi:hypothetical protein
MRQMTGPATCAPKCGEAREPWRYRLGLVAKAAKGPVRVGAESFDVCRGVGPGLASTERAVGDLGVAGRGRTAVRGAEVENAGNGREARTTAGAPSP